METSLHRQLKSLYAGADETVEVALEGYRIDAVRDDLLIEIQHGSLGAIRDKVQTLLASHRVLVVKPIVARKRLVKQTKAGGGEVGRRLSPKRGQILDLFHELIHFTRVFPHRRLTLEVPLVEIEEWRYPGHGRRRRWRRNDHQVEDQRLVAVLDRVRLRTPRDLARLIPGRLPRPFHTGHLAELLGVDRWVAQRVAYCLRETGAVSQAGKQGNAWMYRWAPGIRRAA